MIKSYTASGLNLNRLPRQIGLMLATAVSALTLLGQAASATTADDLIGLWYNDTGRGAVEIAPCGESLCGHIVWLKSNVSSRGGPLRDLNNPDPGRQNRKICGLQVIGGLSRQSDGSWDNGRIYDPRTGKEYDVTVSKMRNGKLAVTGYAGIKLLSRTIIWTRAPADLQRCAS